MSTFAIILNEPNAEVEQRIRDAYGDCLKVNDAAWLVTGDLSVAEITDVVGFTGEATVANAAGFVLSLNGSYAGRVNKDTWAWLDRAEAARATA